MGKLISYTGIDYSGRTTVILNKALLLAKEGFNVLMIDADQTKGRLAAALNIQKKEMDLAQAVTGLDKGAFDKCFIKDKKTRITFITLSSDAKSSGLFRLTSNQAEIFFDRVKYIYDYVLVDCGSIHYEALSMMSLYAAYKVFIVVPSEKRGAIWLKSNDTILSSLRKDKDIFEYVMINTSEFPELSKDLLFKDKKAEELPYVFNMGDYTVAGEIFANNPTGKRAEEYVKGIEALIEKIKG